ncbi:PaREP1 domain containing protein [Pyrobaculum arsenaticum DSM 13514]|uniref:PaREP1 domain containing protein n=1 Tax=Pyrobaculum arsenaticum (strain DSM 13514 / JCM 11321 / PZ6) TaxID=340102 RepID=A4WHY7_PYRAR|nr:PaREP1 domain containing protein [Pyrobaculum arsenaticum DSM 13514]
MDVEALERPLPKPSSEDYAAARLLEALVEARLALEFLNRGLVRNAAGKAFQAWRALLAALLKLELDKLAQKAKTEEERKWLMERAVPRIPTTKMVRLSQKLEEVGHVGISAWTSVALDLHDYQYNGPDPDMAQSKFQDREEAAYAVLGLVREVAKRAEELKQAVKWDKELEQALTALQEEL